jgi:hypothetical protein
VVLLSSGCARLFTADKAQTRLVFAVGDEAAPVEAAQLEAVRAIVAQRVQEHPLTASFIVQAEQRSELIVLTPTLTETQIAAVRDLVTRPAPELALLANSATILRSLSSAKRGRDPVEAARTARSSATESWSPHDPTTMAIAVRDVDHEGRSERQVLVVGRPQQG